MYIEFAAEGIAMRVWNSSETALEETPTNSSVANGLRAIFGTGDLIQLSESFLKRLGGDPETTYELQTFGNFPLEAVGETNVSIIAVSWATDTVLASIEKESVSPLTLTAIVVGAIAILVELVFRNF